MIARAGGVVGEQLQAIEAAERDTAVPPAGKENAAGREPGAPLRRAEACR